MKAFIRIHGINGIIRAGVASNHGVDYSDAVKGSIELTLERMAATGEAIGHLADGLLVFVPGGLPGERVEIEIVHRRRNFARGTLIRVLQAAPTRVTPPCGYFGRCGGCDWQHIDYAAQLDFKTHQVREQLIRVGKLAEPVVRAAVRPCLPSPRPDHYRNHIQMVTSPHGQLGFYAEGTHEVVEVDQCWIADEAINTMLAQHHAANTPLALRVGVNTGEHSVIPEPFGRRGAVDVPPIHERIGAHDYLLSADSFFQVNSHVAALLADEVLRALNLTGSENVLDLYCGVGLFTVPISDRASRVVGIEANPAATRDATLNLRKHTNVEMYTADVRLALSNWTRITQTKWDAIVLDPPRAGVEHAALQAMAALRSPKLVYVSCDPATLARDIKLLAEHGYLLSTAQPLDMFPQTHHVETVAELVLGS